MDTIRFLGAVGHDLRYSVRTLRLNPGLAGLAGAYTLERFIRALLFGVQPADIASRAIDATLLALVAFGAALFPARRASRVDPLTALRHE
jgi:ABC-type lipoprotein release transport system permease subunit